MSKSKTGRPTQRPEPALLHELRSWLEDALRSGTIMSGHGAPESVLRRVAFAALLEALRAVENGTTARAAAKEVVAEALREAMGSTIHFYGEGWARSMAKKLSRKFGSSPIIVNTILQSIQAIAEVLGSYARGELTQSLAAEKIGTVLVRDLGTMAGTIAGGAAFGPVGGQLGAHLGQLLATQIFLAALGSLRERRASAEGNDRAADVCAEVLVVVTILQQQLGSSGTAPAPGPRLLHESFTALEDSFQDLSPEAAAEGLTRLLSACRQPGSGQILADFHRQMSGSEPVTL